MKLFRGFTLSELMIAITVLGILCATVLPALLRNNPNQNKMMMKKAYYTLSDVVSELINDTTLYPGADHVCPYNNSPGYIGFDCGTTAKFAYNFAQHVNMDERITEDLDTFENDNNYKANCTFDTSKCYKLTTTDNIEWEFESTQLAYLAGDDQFFRAMIDVNGDKGPNCYQGNTNNECKDKKSGFDQFIVNVYADGGIELPSDQTWAKEAISVSSDLTGK